MLAGAHLFAQEGASMATPPPPPPPSAGASGESDRPTAPAPEPVRVDGLIHVQQLPSTAQLTKDAEAEGMSITRMEQSADRIVVTYRYASGNERTFAYTTVLPENPDAQVDAPPAMPAPESPRYTVIYREPAPVYYYPRYYYDPYPFRSSFSIGLGFGNFGHYGRSHYYHGGFRGGHHSPRWRR